MRQYSLRAALIAALCVGLIFLFWPAARAAPDLAIRDLFDKRPVREVLLIGNSRTYYHDMPIMLRRMADSANFPERLHIVMRAFGGATLEEHWQDPKTRALLKNIWHDTIFQAQSGAHINDQERNAFLVYGQKLITEAKNTSSKPAIIVNWAYSESSFRPGKRTIYLDRIREDYASLSNQTGARLVEVANAWERVLTDCPSIPLYEDGNHPTTQGSYVSALVLYAYLSHSDGSQVTYVPLDMTESEAAAIRKAVTDWTRGY